MPEISMPQVLIGALLNLFLGVAAYRARSVDLGGMLAGILYGSLIFALLGWRGFLILLLFFILGTGCSKHKVEFKAKLGVAQEKGGRRGWPHATANVGTGVLLAVISALWPSELIILAYVGAFATALSDTVGSELGQVYGKSPILITSFKRVPVGTEGAVSLEGTLLGILASALLALVAVAIGLAPGWAPIPVVVVAAFIGTTAESYLGATIEGLPMVTNETINFLNTLIGAIAAILIGWLAGYR